MVKYFIFGQVISELYDELEWEEFISRVKESSFTELAFRVPFDDSDYQLHKFDYTDFEAANRLLDAFEGWCGYVEITKEQYHKLISLSNAHASND